MAIVRLEHRKFKHFSRMLLQDVGNGDEVAERLAHFLAIAEHHGVVDPVTGQRRMVIAFALSAFGFVVREDQILSATMNVDRGSEMFGDHRGAFDMPARPPGAPWRIPAPFAIRSEENTSELQSIRLSSYRD